MNADEDIVIVGAGAAGLWAAAICARAGHATLVLEKTPRAGTKILASGGTRCNVTTTLDADAARRTFGKRGASFLRAAFRALPPDAVRRRLESLGVATKAEPVLEKVFPRSDSAKEVRDALFADAKAAGARFAFQQRVLEVTRAGPLWSVRTAKGVTGCRALLLAPGGKSYPRTGTTGDGYAWLASLGLTVVPPVPALVPLVSSESWVRALSGLSVDAEVSVAGVRRRRPVLFTHRGLSGPGAMDVSVHVSRAAAPTRITLDLLPDHSRALLQQTLIDAAGARGAPSIRSVVPLPRRLLAAAMQHADVGSVDMRAQELSKFQRARLIDTLKALPIVAQGTEGFARAEVTAGGLALGDVDHRTMEVKELPGLHVMGELLDVAGPIGGLNFQAAFATAELAARAAVRSLGAARPAR